MIGIGKKIYKPLNGDYTDYTATAQWCNENNAMIVERDNYYEVVEVPPYVPSQAYKKSELTRKLNTIKSAYQGAQIMGTDTTQLQKEYKETVDKIKRLQKEGVTIAD